MVNIKYEMRTIESSDYNSHGDVLVLNFTNGITSKLGPSGHSDEHALTEGTEVLCRLEEGGGGFYLNGLAKITGFSKEGRPISFGHSMNWSKPKESDEIADKRK